MGSCGVGKSALIGQLVKSCTVTDLTIKDLYPQVVVDGEPCQLEILETAGSEQNPNQFLEFLRCGDGFLCVYAVDDIKSFVTVNIFRDQLLRAKNTDRVPFVLVSNKIDIANWLVTPMLAEETAKNFRVPFVETSAKTCQNVEYVFHELIREIRKMPAKEPRNLPSAEQNQGCGFKYCTIM
ncbi:GTPase NRas-like [Antechinus flavipes]|uniref:GTPase NRas-like n=1 Tax=Antechinus flavipes TaxID=38775 RepID=UPI0022355C6D|nr:GTPase NRas-like [Antechinus flavipes]